MSVVYICSPFRAADEAYLQYNIIVAKQACRKAVLQGHQVICPHIFYTQFLDDNNPQERAIGVKAGMEMLKLSDELWVIGDTISEGMTLEISKAKELGIPIKYIAK